MLRIKNILYFKAPVIIGLQYLDIVLEEKSLLLLTWKFKHDYYIVIQGVKGKFRSRESGAIVRIPDDTEFVTLTVSSFWRRRKIRLSLKRIAPSREVSRSLIRQFKPFKMPEMKLRNMLLVLPEACIHVPDPHLENCDYYLRPMNIEIRNDRFIYQY